MHFTKTAALAGLVGLASAQTYTDCNPTTNTSMSPSVPSCPVLKLKNHH